jgi:hypothetical protein
MEYMTKIKLNFYCPEDMANTIDKMAEADHRDRTSMLNKMLAFYISEHPPANGAKPTPAKKKKAGTR